MNLFIPHYWNYLPLMASLVTDFFIKVEMLVCASPKVIENPCDNMLA